MTNGANARTLQSDSNSKVKPFQVRDVYHLIDVLRPFNLSRDMTMVNISKYGYLAETEFILESLGIQNVKGKKKIKLTERVKKQAELFHFIFDTNHNCFVRLRNKVTGAYRAYPVQALQDPYKLQAILKTELFRDNTDIMYSLNTYNNMYKADDASILSMHLIALDVDFTEVEEFKNAKPSEIIKLLRQEFGTSIPTPNVIEYGHRIRLLYKLEAVGATKKSKNLVRKVAEALAEKIKRFGASAQASTTYARILGSRNSKNNAVIKLNLLRAEPYQLRELQKTLLPEPEWKTKIKKANRNVIYVKNEYTYNLARLRDFERIQRVRGEGYRELLCYLYRNYCLLTGMSKKEAENALLRFNEGFDVPLRPRQAEQDTRHLERKQYTHKSETILELLDISPAEEKSLKLEAIVGDRELARRHNEREKARYRQKAYGDSSVSKKALLEQEKQKIRSLLAEGFTRKDICVDLEITQDKYRRLYRELKAEGQLPV